MRDGADPARHHISAYPLVVIIIILIIIIIIIIINTMGVPVFDQAPFTPVFDQVYTR